jgi:glycolate oxidase subunit GlcD
VEPVPPPDGGLGITVARIEGRTVANPSLERELRALCGDDGVLPGTTREYLHDATEHEGLEGRAGAIVLPADEAQLAAVVAWCYEHEVPMVPRGGGTGFAGGCVPLDGEVVVGVERMDSVLAFDPGLWRMRVEAGVTTARVRRVARESGLLFPPDPGAAEQSLIGGNIATNAGGPHAFKYGVTGAWVTGLRAVVPPGELAEVGGPVRKDVAGYDLRGLLIGSEGTLGIVTAAWLRLVPAPEHVAPVAATYADVGEGCAAIEAVLAAGLVPAALEYLDEGALAASGGSFPGRLSDGARFMVIAEADGSRAEVEDLVGELREALEPGALSVEAPSGRGEIEALWRWRDGVSVAVAATRGGKVSEDIAVPLDRVREGIERTVEIGRRHDLAACSWGHAGDGNLHSTFTIDPRVPAERERARAAAEELFALAVELGGTISGEHGLGWAKRGQLERQWGAPAMRLHRAVKEAFDPKGLMNPGKKA